ncbi:hypothetical protein WICANDRAFT_65270 [Wickerhamomyces anomalus NRRL Y-366-8]|uniref:BSD domain-containing protein n=1 Tax=Wickerhamomyces anomalus (strain ATCC 58044 / CBS 1984 / NCYC 433 / NRRL Y-366-8) TaxID=683960 RepID=A0A1E3NV49_WICAA|nr:uncharacterized protein WICANDRAFT_65270 [Wickerhamomyces anomalus NRRL Y-366-8]ODQ57006.1 hypothetical protein WICANDRAFT_65270 [Wickerhamomyces anomalus NRRL Y-366-8]
MDLIYEQSANSKTNESQETLKATNSNDPSNELNKKTEESFEKFENEVSKTYDAIETKASTWGASFGSFISNFKVNDYINETRKQVENFHLDEKVNLTKSTVTKKFEEIQSRLVNEENTTKSKNMWSLLSNKTNTYLDELDKELEQVETFAGSYVNKFGQFIKDSIVISNPEDEDELIDDSEGDLLFNVLDDSKSRPQKVTSTRTEAQLYALHTSPELYLTNAQDETYDQFKKSFKLDSKTEDIAALLKQNVELNKLSTSIVPEKVKYDEFWTRYFYLYDKILKEESNRKKLLKKGNDTNETKSENVEWSDEEEGDENDEAKNKHEKSTTSSEGTYELKSVNSSTLDVTKEARNTKNKDKTNSNKNDDNDDDEDDDDWE